MQTRTNIVISCVVGVAILSIIALRGGDRGTVPVIAAERIPANEKQYTARLTGEFQRQFEASKRSDPNSRGTRAKYHGCVRAEFAVVENLAPELSVGIFQPGARYPAWVRFSNNPDPHAEVEPDIRSMEIKLLEVAGQKLLPPGLNDNDSHDLVLFSQPVFPFPNVETYTKRFEAFTSDKSLQFYFNPFDSHIKLFLNSRENKNVIQHTDLLHSSWFSAVPYRYGDQHAVKYSTRPCSRSLANIRDEPGDEYLQDQLKRHLASDSGCFEFLVQFQTDPEAMPIEDASIEWNKLFAPFEPIALLTIAAQNFDSREQMKVCENRSFNPWRALPEHRPLGGINRARREIFTALAKFKNRQRDAAASEPTMH